ncbi:hypothetical protein M569_15001, partial [Genlisea aurea]
DSAHAPESSGNLGGEQRRNLDSVKKSPFFPFSTPSPARYFRSKKSPAPNGTPGRSIFKRPFPPPSPAKHIKAALARRHGSVKPNEAAGESKNQAEGANLDKRFGFAKNFYSRFDMGEEVGRGHFGYTCRAKFKKGDLKGQDVAVKLIPKSKMTTAVAIEDVRKEVKILKALTGHANLVQFHDSFEDNDNVYIVME